MKNGCKKKKKSTSVCVVYQPHFKIKFFEQSAGVAYAIVVFIALTLQE